MKSTTQLHRGLALALLLTVLASLYYGVVQPLADTYRSYDEQIEQATLRLTKLRQIAGTRGHIESKLRQVRRNDKSKHYFLSGRTPGLAAVALQNNIKTAIESAEGELSSFRILSEATEGDLTKVSAAMRLKASTVGLQEILYSLETGVPLVFIDRLSVRSRSYYSYYRRYRRNRAPTESLLDIDLEVSGYTRASQRVDSI